MVAFIVDMIVVMSLILLASVAYQLGWTTSIPILGVIGSFLAVCILVFGGLFYSIARKIAHSKWYS